MIREDTILDIKDNINTIFFCLDNDIGSLEVDVNDLVESINLVKKSVLNDVYRLRTNDTFNVIESKRVQDLMKGKLSSRVSLLYRMDELKNRMRREGEKIKVSKNVMKNLMNNV